MNSIPFKIATGLKLGKHIVFQGQWFSWLQIEQGQNNKINVVFYSFLSSSYYLFTLEMYKPSTETITILSMTDIIKMELRNVHFNEGKLNRR